MAGFACIAACLLLAACSDQSRHADSLASGGAAQASVADAAGQGEGLQALLAYEHNASVTLASDRILPRLQQAQAACNDRRFGDCVVLNVAQQGGDHPAATLGMRMVPAAVEPMVALASADAELGSRSTRAEDLAVVVRDNNLAQQRLVKERERLQEFQSRRDLAVADMIALSRQLAETEAELEAAVQEGAQHRRRIDTQLLTIEFRPTSAQEGRNEIWTAVRESGATLASGIAWMIRVLAFLLPVLVLAAVVIAWWRRRRRRNR